jgi:anti-anti-sigma factor
MDITIERRVASPGTAGDVVELVVTGRIDAETGPALEQAVAESITESIALGGRVIRLDCAAVGFLSSAGIRSLFNCSRAAQAAGGRCRVGASSPQVARVLELTRLDSILCESASAGAAAVAETPSPPRDRAVGGIVLVGLESPGDRRLTGILRGNPAGIAAANGPEEMHQLSARGFGLGLAAVAGHPALRQAAGETVAACGAVFQRPPQPFAAVDYSLPRGAFVPAVQVVSGVFWEGLPPGAAGFRPAGDAAAVRFDDLAAALLKESRADAVAIVLVAEVHGLIGAELIRPLAEATPEDQPLAATPAVAARWLSFSREPVHARQVAVVVGIVTRPGREGLLAGFVRPLGAADATGHAHAVVFPARPLPSSGPADLAALVAELSAAEPLAVLHLLGDPQPVLGSGQSEFNGGCCWFAPLDVAGGGWA